MKSGLFLTGLVILLLGCQSVSSRSPAVVTPITQVPTLPPVAPVDQSRSPMPQTIQAAAKQKSGFDVKVPMHLPPGYSLSQLQYDAEQQAVILLYAHEQGRAMLILTEQKIAPAFHLPDEAQVEKVVIGTAQGEYFQGGWFSVEGGAQVWQSQAPVYTVRWRESDLYFTLIFSGDRTNSQTFLTKQALVDFGEGLTFAPGTK